MNFKVDYVLGMLCIIAGLVIIIYALGAIALRVLIGLFGLSIINYGLKLRKSPSLQMIIPMVLRRHRWF